jgi:hypothetical protein
MGKALLYFTIYGLQRIQELKEKGLNESPALCSRKYIDLSM